MSFRVNLLLRLSLKETTSKHSLRYPGDRSRPGSFIDDMKRIFMEHIFAKIISLQCQVQVPVSKGTLSNRPHSLPATMTHGTEPHAEARFRLLSDTPQTTKYVEL